MSIMSKNDKCKHCGKEFIVIVESLPSKMDEKRESYYCCPYCEKVVDTIRLQGSEEVFCKKV